MNGSAHRLIAGVASWAYFTDQEHRQAVRTSRPLVNGLLSSALTGLPDLIEPATSPNHRQFFHSVAFVVLLCTAIPKLRAWKPQEPRAQMCKDLLLLAVGAYLVHLALDATTTKSLPLIGKL